MKLLERLLIFVVHGFFENQHCIFIIPETFLSNLACRTKLRRSHYYLAWSNALFSSLWVEHSWHSVFWQIWNDWHRQSFRQCSRQSAIFQSFVVNVSMRHDSSNALLFSAVTEYCSWLLNTNALMQASVVKMMTTTLLYKIKTKRSSYITITIDRISYYIYIY